MTPSEETEISTTADQRFRAFVEEIIDKAAVEMPNVSPRDVLATVHLVLCQHVGKIEHLLVETQHPDTPEVRSVIRNHCIKLGFETSKA